MCVRVCAPCLRTCADVLTHLHTSNRTPSLSQSTTSFAPDIEITPELDVQAEEGEVDPRQAAGLGDRGNDESKWVDMELVLPFEQHAVGRPGAASQ